MPIGLLKKFKFIILLLLLLLTDLSRAKEITVFDIRRPISLENNQEMQKDFYINAGLEAGLKVGMTVVVNRRLTLYDPFQSKSPGDLVVPVGKLRIIHTQENISVARMVEIMGREQLPGLEYDAIMVGDRLDMTTVKMGKTAALQESAAPENDTIQAQVETQTVVPTVAPVDASKTESKVEVSAAPSMLNSVNQAVDGSTPNVASSPSTLMPMRESSSQLPTTRLPGEGSTL